MAQESLPRQKYHRAVFHSTTWQGGAARIDIRLCGKTRLPLSRIGRVKREWRPTTGRKPIGAGDVREEFDPGYQQGAIRRGPRNGRLRAVPTTFAGFSSRSLRRYARVQLNEVGAATSRLASVTQPADPQRGEGAVGRDQRQVLLPRDGGDDPAEGVPTVPVHHRPEPAPRSPKHPAMRKIASWAA